MSTVDDLLADLQRQHPAAAELALRVSLPVRVTPAFVRLARLRLLPHAGTGDEADLWLSPLVESRSGAGFAFRRDVRERLRATLATDASLLDKVWNDVHSSHASWLSPRARMEEELTWRLLADPEDPEIDTLWASVVRDLDEGPNAEGVARWVTRAMADLPPGSLMHVHGNRAFHGAHLLLGDASVFGDQPQAFLDSATFAFATRRLPRVSLQVGAIEDRVIASASQPIRGGHEIRIPATRPMWLQVERQGPVSIPTGRWVLRLDPADTSAELLIDAPFVRGSTPLRLRALDGAAWDLLPADTRSDEPAAPRPPLVDLTYEVELYGVTKRVHLPFVIGVLADLGHPQERRLPMLEERKFLELDVDNFDARLGAVRPSIAFKVPAPFMGDVMVAVSLEFTSLEDFSPSVVAKRVPRYGDWQLVSTGLSTLAEAIDAGDLNSESILKLLADKVAMNQLLGLPWDHGSDTPSSSTATSTPHWTAIVGSYVKVDQALAHDSLSMSFQALAHAAETFGAEALAFPDLLRGIEEVRERIRQGLNGLLDEIYHHPDFRRLEGTWRGLHHLVSHTETNEMTKFRVINISKKELVRTLVRSAANEWDQSILFKKIYEEEFGQFGGEPYGLLVVDFEFDHQPTDVAALQGLARIGAASHAPVLSNASPALFQMDSWRDLASMRDLAKLFTTPEYAAWQHLREQDDSRYLCLTLPRLLARSPWTADRSGDVPFDESTEGEADDQFVWMGSAHLMASNVASAFSRYRWFARMAGVESGGLVNQLPTHGFRGANAATPEISPTGVAITDRLEAGLAQLGFAALSARRNSDSACFYSVQTLHRPVAYDDPGATQAARAAARLPMVLVCSRLMLYLGSILRDRVGGFRSNDAIERQLNDWIAQYIGPDDVNAEGHSAAMRPLASAEVRISPAGDSEGRFLVVATIAPRYQFPGNAIPMRLNHPVPLQLSA